MLHHSINFDVIEQETWAVEGCVQHGVQPTIQNPGECFTHDVGTTVSSPSLLFSHQNFIYTYLFIYLFFHFKRDRLKNKY